MNLEKIAPRRRYRCPCRPALSSCRPKFLERERNRFETPSPIAVDGARRGAWMTGYPVRENEAERLEAL